MMYKYLIQFQKPDITVDDSAKDTFIKSFVSVTLDTADIIIPEMDFTIE